MYSLMNHIDVYISPQCDEKNLDYDASVQHVALGLIIYLDVISK